MSSQPAEGTDAAGLAPSPPKTREPVKAGALHALQADLQLYILHGQGPVVARIGDGAQAGATECLGIYAEAYRLRLVDALRNDYPALGALLGDAELEAVALGYIDRHPPRHFSLRHFGARMASYLASDPELGSHPHLSELAALEWALIEAFDAPDLTPLSQAEIASVPPDDWAGMRLELHPSLQRLDLRSNAPALRSTFNEGRAMPAPTLAATRTPWLVWRKDLETYFRPLASDEAWALDAAGRGSPFAAICEGLCEWVPEEEAPRRAAGLLSRWVTDGLVTAAGSLSD
jgi:hypothetical protein